MHAIAKIEERPGALGELALCRVIGTYLRLSGDKAVIVFDGTGPPDKSGFDATRNLEVLFAGLGTDADSVVEDKIKASTAPKGLTIVSSDRRLRQAARTRRATAVKSDVFWTLLQRELSRKRTRPEPAAKRQGLSQSETEQWLDVFGLGQ